MTTTLEAPAEAELVARIEAVNDRLLAVVEQLRAATAKLNKIGSVAVEQHDHAQAEQRP
jgi:hypothetical protein